MNRVFIGMPVYNGERFIRKAIVSLLAQSYKDWTLFISDDCSTDGTALICKEYEKTDPRIIYVRQVNNIGMFANYKFTLDEANLPFFMWAAQDDLWDKDYIKTCMEFFEHDKDLGFASTCTLAIDSFERPLSEVSMMKYYSGKPGFRKTVRFIMEPEILGKCNLMYSIFKTEALRKTWNAYPQRKVWGQDYMFSLAAVARFPAKISGEFMFKKRLGGYSSPHANIEDPKKTVTDMNIKNPKNHIFPFGRFRQYLRGHLEALNGTPYLFTAYLLYLRLPRAFLIHIRNRSLRSFISRKFSFR